MTTMLYRPATEPNDQVWGLSVEHRIFEDDALDEPLSSGWFETPQEAAAGPDLNDKGVKEITATLPDLTDEDLLALLDKEQAGKTRKSVVAAIEAEIERRSAPDKEPA